MDTIKSTTVFKQGQQHTKPARRFLRKFLNDWSLNFAAMLAYNLLIALLPTAVALFGIFGLVLKNHPEAQENIKMKIINSFPADNTTQSGINQIVELAFNQLSKDAGGLLAIGIFFAMFGASRLFIVIDKCLAIVYRLPERTFLRQNLLAFGMLFIFIILIVIMLVASSAPSALLSIIPGGGGRFGAFIAGMLSSLLVAFILFETIYWIVPNKKMSFKVTWCGALVAACTLEIFIILFPLYVRRFMGNYAGKILFFVNKYHLFIFLKDKLVLLLFFFYFYIILQQY